MSVMSASVLAVTRAMEALRASVITRHNTIRARHIVREEVAGLSTGRYYHQWTEFKLALDNTLRRWGLMTYGALETPYQREGRMIVPILPNNDDTYPPTVGHCHISWYRMPQTGNWEITVYLT